MPQFNSNWTLDKKRVWFGLPPELQSGIPKGDFSASRAKRYVDCPKQYGWSGERKSGANIAMRKGSVIHKVLEILGKDYIKDPGFKVNSKSVKKLLQDTSAKYKLNIHEFRECWDILKQHSSIDFSRSIAFEEPFVFPTDYGSVCGVLDRIDFTTDCGLEIIDYKSGFLVPEYDELLEDLQHGIYQVVCKRMFKNAKSIRITFWYIASNQKVTVDWSPEIDDFSLATMNQVFRDIKSDTTYKAFVGPHCNRCPFNRDCLEFQKEKKNETSVSPYSLSVEELVNERQRKKMLAEAFESDRKDCDRLIKGILDTELFLNGTGWKAQLKSRTLDGWNTEPIDVAQEITNLISESDISMNDVLSDIVQIDDKKLESFISRQSEDVQKKIRDKLEEFKSPKNHITWVDVRKAK